MQTISLSQRSGLGLERSAAAVWLNGRRWDLTWIVGSALIVPAVLLVVWSGVPSSAIDLGVTALVGGPHLFATYTVTYLDPRFRQTHRRGLVAVTALIPALVVYAAITRYQVLVSVFIFWASLHVLQQNAYLADLYRLRGGMPDRWWSRTVDYGMLMLSFYPAAAYRLVHADFKIAGVPVLVPSFLLRPGMVYLVWAAFASFTVAWILKTALERRRGTLNVPKTVLIAVTTIIAFCAPLAERGDRLDLAFQAVNAWHSFQYLGMVWLVQKLRNDRGMTGSPALAWISRRGWRLYAACGAVTIAMLAGIELVKRADPLHLAPGQYYFGLVLSALLIHYALDAYLFGFSLGRRGRAMNLPYAAPVGRLGIA